MNSEELYVLLTNFEEESLEDLGLEKEGEYWIHSNSRDRFRVTDNRLIVNRGGTDIGRLSASFDEPESLYSTLVETELIPVATHFRYLRERGLDI